MRELRQRIGRSWHLKAIISLLAILLLGVWSESGRAETYDDMVVMIQSQRKSVRDKGKQKLVDVLKKEVLLNEQRTDHHLFRFDHFINPDDLDLAIGISRSPYWGDLIILSKQDGHYCPSVKILDIDYIQSIGSVKLFPGSLDQLLMTEITGGSGIRTWFKYIYRWNGQQMKEIWNYVFFQRWFGWSTKPTPPGSGGVTRGKIAYGKIKDEGADISISEKTVRGVYDGNDSHFMEILSQEKNTATYQWDEDLYRYVQFGEIISAGAYPCQIEGRIGECEHFLSVGRKVSLLSITWIPAKDFFPENHYLVFIGNGYYCAIPKDAVKLLK